MDLGYGWVCEVSGRAAQEKWMLGQEKEKDLRHIGRAFSFEGGLL